MRAKSNPNGDKGAEHSPISRLILHQEKETKMNGIKRLIGRLIWNLSESFHISLGNHGPTIFGWMIGAKGRGSTMSNAGKNHEGYQDPTASKANLDVQSAAHCHGVNFHRRMQIKIGIIQEDTGTYRHYQK